MAWYRIAKNVLDAIANAINAKTGHTAPMTPVEMVSEIQSISGGDEGIEVTIVNGITSENLGIIRETLQSGSGKTNFIALRADAIPSSGYYFCGGIYAPDFPGGGIDSTKRRTSESSTFGPGNWSANATVPAGAKFMVWGVADYA